MMDNHLLCYWSLIVCFFYQLMKVTQKAEYVLIYAIYHLPFPKNWHTTLLIFIFLHLICIFSKSRFNDICNNKFCFLFFLFSHFLIDEKKNPTLVICMVKSCKVQKRSLKTTCSIYYSKVKIKTETKVFE